MITRLRERFASWDSSRRLIAVSAAGMLLLTVWAAIAQVDEVTRGPGKVIPSSKAQLVQPAEPAAPAAPCSRG